MNCLRSRPSHASRDTHPLRSGAPAALRSQPADGEHVTERVWWSHLRKGARLHWE